MSVGFSLFGLIVSMLVLAPNLVLLALKPTGSPPEPRIPRLIAVLERAGQALCLVVPAITAPHGFAIAWVPVVVCAVAAYIALWLRYLVCDRTWTALFQSVARVPVPMAILPVVAFAATAGVLGNIWILGSALILGAGHIPIALASARALRVR